MVYSICGRSLHQKLPAGKTEESLRKSAFPLNAHLAKELKSAYKIGNRKQ